MKDANKINDWKVDDMEINICFNGINADGEIDYSINVASLNISSDDGIKIEIQKE